ncbi:metal-dependent hydrolase [Haloquadratum walsbyi]|jgi:hypothetical protein|uniref:Membrane-bound metal-dependent hydrolase (DUF457) n=1 Tax=Haloquadratum walsbyi J07HQW2 TaxID=1238425 RepID=U1NEB1_9EURY|nr:metal-dependent hydrolase [Haloquadratum walsbyi]ERG95345.1 MAG: hypothetical protein J07HQW2_01799 [Haloquadratum walsbyi J07HQW2]
MTPLGHLALALIIGRTLKYNTTALRLCLLATFLPDIIDKPLFAIGVSITGHTIGHSVLTFSVISILLISISRLRFLIPILPGYGSHIIADLIVAYPKFLTNYFWPILPQRPTPDDPVIQYWIDYATSITGIIEFIPVIIALWIIIVDRYTPLADTKTEPSDTNS